MRCPKATMVAAMMVAVLVGAAPETAVRTVRDFQGTWRVARWVGESQGGFSGPDPQSLVGSTMTITAENVRTPDRVCRLKDAAVRLVDNGVLETSLWGGQAIGALRLPHALLGAGFGRERTQVFEDGGLCVSAVMLDREHIVDAFGSGVIFELERVR